MDRVWSFVTEKGVLPPLTRSQLALKLRTIEPQFQMYRFLYTKACKWIITRQVVFSKAYTLWYSFDFLCYKTNQSTQPFECECIYKNIRFITKHPLLYLPKDRYLFFFFYLQKLPQRCYTTLVFFIRIIL